MRTVVLGAIVLVLITVYLLWKKNKEEGLLLKIMDEKNRVSTVNRDRDREAVRNENARKYIVEHMNRPY
jgi:FtsZ-interacting cell division protein ZipA